MGGLHETLVDTVMKSEKKNPYQVNGTSNVDNIPTYTKTI